MSYHVYSTEGVVLGSIPYGESNKVFFILTKKFGLVRAVAQSIRELKSKLRYSLQEGSVINVDLVHGKDIWRITNASEVASYQMVLREHGSYIVGRIFFLLKRLIHGEEPDVDLYEIIVSFLLIVSKNILTEKQHENVDILLHIQILSRLGYGSSENIIQYFAHAPLTIEIVDEITEHKTTLIKHIQETLQSTQM